MKLYPILVSIFSLGILLVACSSDKGGECNTEELEELRQKVAFQEYAEEQIRQIGNALDQVSLFQEGSGGVVDRLDYINRIHTMDSTILKAEAEIAKLEKDLASAKGGGAIAQLLKSKKRELSKAKKRIKELEDLLEQSDQDKINLQQMLDQVKSKVADLENERDRLNDDISNKLAAIAAAEQRLQNLRDEAARLTQEANREKNRADIAISEGVQQKFDEGLAAKNRAVANKNKPKVWQDAIRTACNRFCEVDASEKNLSNKKFFNKITPEIDELKGVNKFVKYMAEEGLCGCFANGGGF
ncbi:MAG: hypothetical protein MK212_15495 [Saprospiraceae bacterium]|nr:hypothetical protein [Saprospiraceae bacterium]